jgi:hypothetical protein
VQAAKGTSFKVLRFMFTDYVFKDYTERSEYHREVTRDEHAGKQHLRAIP